MRLSPVHMVLIGAGIVGALGTGLAVIRLASADYSAHPVAPTSVESRVEPSLDTQGSVPLSHRWVEGAVNAQFDHQEENGWFVFDVDRKISPSCFERLEIWIALDGNAFHAQGRAWWQQDSSHPVENARAIRGVVQMNAARMPDRDDERVLEYSLDATRNGDPVHLAGKLTFGASDLSPAR